MRLLFLLLIVIFALAAAQQWNQQGGGGRNQGEFDRRPDSWNGPDSFPQSPSQGRKAFEAPVDPRNGQSFPGQNNNNFERGVDSGNGPSSRPFEGPNSNIGRDSGNQFGNSNRPNPNFGRDSPNQSGPSRPEDRNKFAPSPPSPSNGPFRGPNTNTARDAPSPNQFGPSNRPNPNFIRDPLSPDDRGLVGPSLPTSVNIGGSFGPLNGPNTNQFSPSRPDDRNRFGPSLPSSPSNSNIFGGSFGPATSTSGRDLDSTRNERNQQRGVDNKRGGSERGSTGSIWGPTGPEPLNIQEKQNDRDSNNREKQDRGKGRGGKGWKRSRAIDNAHAFSNLRKFGKGTRSLRSEDWKEHAEHFCSLFPHHGKCRDGKRPEQSDLASVSKAIERRQGRRRVPKIKDIDWLNGVPESLKERTKDRREKFGRTSNETRNHFRNACRSGRINCRVQPEQSRKNRQLLRDHLAKVEKEELKLDDETADDNVEIRFDRTLRIKRALLEKANLTAEVDPIDDGIFEQDILLTENQSNMILNHLDKANSTGDEDLSPDEIDEAPKDLLPPSDPLSAAASVDVTVSTESTPSSSSESSSSESASSETPPTAATEAARHRRSGVFVEQNFAEKWDISTPIPYTFDDSIAPWDRTDITDALTEISRVSCIRFRFLSTPPNGYHINFVKIDSPTFCGLSYVGRVSPVNTVYLSFQCGKNRGVVMHETLHALGVIHQHLRVDRDNFIKVEWSNVNPQKYDQFATADQSLYTSYGIKYSYDSIMHYNAYTNAIDVKKPTMVPLTNSQYNLSLLGQRDQLSITDINLINKMYCKPASCVDTNIYCGHWALTGTCTLQGNSVWMSQNCRKSCNLC